MKTGPIVAAALQYTAAGVPFAAAFGDVYHPEAGALAQARHVFLAGNGLPARWAGRERFVVLETGFGLGSNFLATWAAWRGDPHRCERLHFVSIERHPLTRDTLATLRRESELAELGAALTHAWPPLVQGLHTLAFDGGLVRLHLAFGDVADWLPEIVARVDAFYLDGFAPDRNPAMWEARLFKAMARLAAADATAATWSAARRVRDGLASAGFEVQRLPGVGGKRDITTARHVPPATRRSTPIGRPGPRDVPRQAVIVGGGLGGCAAAWALAEQGWRSDVIDRRAAPAAEASGNPAGLFHGIVNAQDGTHARLHRAAALAAERVLRQAVERDGVRGAVTGLLRLAAAGDETFAMRALVERHGLPSSYVQALDAAEASARAGIPLQQPAWFYPGGGWVAPQELAAWYLRQAGDRVRWQGGREVARLQRDGAHWLLLDAQGAAIARAQTVVLANAADAMRLLGTPPWPIERVRGQLSFAAAAGLSLPRLPLADSGYVLPAIDGQVVFGASSQRDDDDASVRRVDHEYNLDLLQRLLGRDAAPAIDQLEGRTAWRCSSVDRLPLIGAVPDAAVPAQRGGDQPRFVPRLPGLFVFTALGSRGISWSALGAQVLAAWVSDAPMPVEASLMDAVDPARFAARAVRREAARGGSPVSGRPGPAAQA